MIKKQPTKILMADDHILLRDALASVINASEDFEVTGLAENGQRLLDIIDEDQLPDIIILDLNMPTMDGYETAAKIQKRFPTIKILILTMYDSEIALIRLLQIGVRGFIKKDIHPDQLTIALNTVAEEGYYYSNSATGKLASFLHKAHNTRLSIDKALLSELEIKFLKLAGTDLTYKEIALVMKLSPRAIDSHRDGLFEKLEVKSRVGLAIYAVKHGVITF